MIQQIIIDSISANTEIYPYTVTTYARLEIFRESNRTLRRLISQCDVENCQRSDNNPHGFIIKNFIITNNEDIQKTKRY
jgi:hypothetical protein